MKITSLNLQGFDNWETRQSAIADYLTRESPDVILFQEAVYLPELSAYNQAQLLNTTLGYPYQQSVISRLQVGLEYPVYREGLVALSRHPIVSSDSIVLRQDANDEHQRIVQLLDVYVDDQLVKLANVHFSITDITDFASPQLRELLNLLAARGEQRIIAGDFNINHLEDFADLWQGDYTASTDFDYTSYPGMDKRNDYFLIPKDYQFTDVSTSGDGLSDHRALTATIAVDYTSVRGLVTVTSLPSPQAINA